MKLKYNGRLSAVSIDGIGTIKRGEIFDVDKTTAERIIKANSKEFTTIVTTSKKKKGGK